MFCSLAFLGAFHLKEWFVSKTLMSLQIMNAIHQSGHQGGKFDVGHVKTLMNDFELMNKISIK